MGIQVSVQLGGIGIRLHRGDLLGGKMVGGHVQDPGGSTDIVMGHGRHGFTGCLQLCRIYRMAAATAADALPAGLPVLVGEDMSKQQVTRQDLAYIQGSDRFCQPGVATVDVCTCLLGGLGAGLGITAGAGPAAGFCGTQEGAEGRKRFRVGKQLAAVAVKDHDSQAGDPVEILQQFFKLVGMNYGIHKNLPVLHKKSYEYCIISADDFKVFCTDFYIFSGWLFLE